MGWSCLRPRIRRERVRPGRTTRPPGADRLKLQKRVAPRRHPLCLDEPRAASLRAASLRAASPQGSVPSSVHSGQAAAIATRPRLSAPTRRSDGVGSGQIPTADALRTSRPAGRSSLFLPHDPALLHEHDAPRVPEHARPRPRLRCGRRRSSDEASRFRCRSRHRSRGPRRDRPGECKHGECERGECRSVPSRSGRSRAQPDFGSQVSASGRSAARAVRPRGSPERGRSPRSGGRCSSGATSRSSR